MDLDYYGVEGTSSLVCIIIIWFMTKPYRLTREGRYLGLPLGFSFLGISYALNAAAFSMNIYQLAWLQLLTRTFAFIFLAATYYFSNKSSDKNRLFWDLSFSVLFIVLIFLSLVDFVIPAFALNSYLVTQVYLRIFGIACLAYISVFTLISHVEKPNPVTIWTPMGYILLGFSQYSLLFRYLDGSYYALVGSWLLRLLGLAVFLWVAYKTFYRSNRSY
jgi:hypothetical protein